MLIAILNLALNILPMCIITTVNIYILVSIVKASNRMQSSASLRGNLAKPVQPPPEMSAEQLKKRGNYLPSRTVRAIPAICLTFIFSYLPYLIACTSNFGVELPDWWRGLSFYFTSINTLSNPVIYAAVNLEFRKYVLALVGLTEISSGACRGDDVSSSVTTSQQVPKRVPNDNSLVCQNG